MLKIKIKLHSIKFHEIYLIVLELLHMDRLAKAGYLTGEFSKVLVAHALKISADESNNLD
jgi:hypothetical protein